MPQPQNIMADPDTDERLLVLSPGDNVAVVLRPVSEDELIRVSGQDVLVPVRVAMGHKIAVAPVRNGAPIVKYGASIGAATADIQIGDHVHLHNIRSNYTLSHSLDAARPEKSDDV